MSEEYQLFIDGEYCDATEGRSFPVTCPGTNEVLAHVPAATVEDVDRSAKAAARALKDPVWRQMAVRDRVQLVQKVGQLILKRQEELARLESLDTGNPIRDTAVYVAGAADSFQFFPPLAYHLTGEQIPVCSDRFDYTLYEPIGVVAIIIPWNDPLEIACGKLAITLAAGNTCILKPSPLAPLTCLRLGEIFLEVGLPRGVVNIVTGTDEEVGTALINHPLVQIISFTGSVPTGQVIQEAAARSTKRVVLELGGKSPNIVFPDADLNRAVPGAAQAIYSMSGQNCVAGSRLFVHEHIHDEFVERLIEESKRYPVGDPLDPRTVLGPLISPVQLAKVKNYVANGREQGAKLVLGGSGPSAHELRRGNFYLPTIFTAVEPAMKIAQDEIFGPVLSVLTFSSLEEVVRLANDTYYGLGAGVWTQNLSLAHRIASLLEAGTIYINTFNEFYQQVPFGGFKRSGLGFEYGLDVLQQYTQRKNVLIKL
jgi:acyl-CoA reductase-like NAD-dependent aldehyde dehydrogenase